MCFLVNFAKFLKTLFSKNTSGRLLLSKADFDNPFINGRGFIYLGISKMSFIFLAFTRAHGINKVYQ